MLLLCNYIPISETKQRRFQKIWKGCAGDRHSRGCRCLALSSWLGGQAPRVRALGEFGNALKKSLQGRCDGARAPIAPAPAAHLDAKRHAGVIASARDAGHRVGGERQAVSRHQPVEVGAQALAVVMRAAR